MLGSPVGAADGQLEPKVEICRASVEVFAAVSLIAIPLSAFRHRIRASECRKMADLRRIEIGGGRPTAAVMTVDFRVSQTEAEPGCAPPMTYSK